MPWRDPDLIGRYVMAGAGSALYGLYLFAIRTRARQAVTVQDVAGVVVNVLCAMACGLILTAALAGRIASVIPWATLRDPGLLAFAFGAFGWELLPLLFPKALDWAVRKADEIEERGQ